MLIGELTVLRRVEREDLNQIADWRNDPEIAQYFFNPFPIVKSGQEQWFQKLLEAMDRLLFVIEDKVSRRSIGTVGFDSIDWKNRSAEYGNMLIGVKEYRGKGLARDATLTLLHYGFEQLNLHRIYLHVAAFNVPGIQLYERCYFQREGILREAFFRDGRYHDILVMSMLRDEFRAGIGGKEA